MIDNKLTANSALVAAAAFTGKHLQHCENANIMANMQAFLRICPKFEPELLTTVPRCCIIYHEMLFGRAFFVS